MDFDKNILNINYVRDISWEREEDGKKEDTTFCEHTIQYIQIRFQGILTVTLTRCYAVNPAGMSEY